MATSYYRPLRRHLLTEAEAADMAREVLAKAQRALAANPVQPRATTAIRPKRPSSMPGLRTSKFKAFVAQFEVWVIGAVTLVCSAAMVTQMVAC